MGILPVLRGALRTCGAVIALGACGAGRMAAQRATPADLGGEIDSLLAPLARAGTFAGTVAVSRDGALVFERGYGLANVEFAVPATVETRYRLHSITKQFTATTVVLLAHEGRLRLDAKLGDVLPDAPPAWRSVTLLQLVQHTSGVPQLEGRWFEIVKEHPVTTQCAIWSILAPLVQRETLTAPAGTTFEYNNFGYDLLSCVIEHASGASFASTVGHRIFEPALMAGAGFDRRGDVDKGTYVASRTVPRLASGYNGAADSLQVAFPFSFGSAGAGGAYASAHDLIEYDRALDAHRLGGIDLDQETLSHVFRVRETAGYGLGWVVRYPSHDRYFLEHSGGDNGYNTDYARYPLDHVAIVVLSNRGAVDAAEIRQRIARIVLGTKYE